MTHDNPRANAGARPDAAPEGASAPMVLAEEHTRLLRECREAMVELGVCSLLAALVPCADSMLRLSAACKRAVAAAIAIKPHLVAAGVL